jgi:hypothetical protein
MTKPSGMGNTNQTLITGRTAYVWNGTDLVPLRGDANGNITLGASTASISNVTLAAGTAAAGTVAVSNTETIQTEMMAIRTIAASTYIASTILALTGVKQATFFIDHARAATAAFGTNGTQYLLQASEKATGNDTWRTLATFTADSTAASSALSSGAIAAAATTIVILSGTAFVANDLVFIADTTAATASEWVRVVSVTGTASFKILDGITNAHADTEVLYNKAENFSVTVDCASLTRARVIVNNNASGTCQNIYSRVAVITAK